MAFIYLRWNSGACAKLENHIALLVHCVSYCCVGVMFLNHTILLSSSRSVMLQPPFVFPPHFCPLLRTCTKLSIQDATAYCLLLNQLAPESCSLDPLHIEDVYERSKAVLAQAERINCRKYITPKDLVEGSANLNLAFVAHLFHTKCVFISISISWISSRWNLSKC